MGLTKRLLRVVALAVPGIASADLLTDASSSWIAAQSASGGVWYDFVSDEPTGNRQLDLLGSSTASTLYQRYSSDALTGGALAFRVRLGSSWTTSLVGTVMVGIDGDQNGSLDLFVGVSGASGSTSVRVWGVDPYRSNTGPLNTAVGPLLYEASGTSSNMSYQSVSFIDRNGVNYDLDGDGYADRYLSFALSFDLLQGIFASKGITVDENSPLRYALLTSQDANIADRGGIYNSYCSGTWASCNALTKAMSAIYQPPPPPPIMPITVPVSATDDSAPEPGTWLLLATGGAALLLRYRMRLRKQA